MVRLKAAQEQGQISVDFDLDLDLALDLDLDLAMTILSGPLYFRFMITQEPVTHDYVDRTYRALFAGMAPRP